MRKEHLEEIEDQYLVCCAVKDDRPPPRKRAKLTSINIAREMALAELAATIKINVLHKVCTTELILMVMMMDGDQ